MHLYNNVPNKGTMPEIKLFPQNYIFHFRRPPRESDKGPYAVVGERASNCTPRVESGLLARFALSSTTKILLNSRTFSNVLLIFKVLHAN